MQMYSVLYVPTSAFGKAIAWWDGVPVCHVATAFCDEPRGEGILFEALAGNTYIRRPIGAADRLHHWRGARRPLLAGSVARARARAEKWHEDKAGYDWGNIAAFVARVNRSAANTQQQRKNKMLLHCSEADFILWGDAGVALGDNVEPWQWTPGDTYMTVALVNV